MSKKPEPRWSLPVYREIVEQVRAHLAPLESQPQERLAAILERATSPSSDEGALTSKNRLEQVIYSMQALMHHARFGGLTQHQIKQLRSLILAILRTQKINEGRAAFAFFYADVHAVMGRIYRREGQLWQAAWNQFIACRKGTPPDPENLGYHYFVSGHRLMRLGHARLAESHYNLALEKGLSTRLRAEAFVLMARLKRLSLDPDAARVMLASATTQSPEASAALANDLVFERLMADSGRPAASATLISALNPRSPLIRHDLALECALFVLADPSSVTIERLPSFRTPKTQEVFGLERAQPLFQLVDAIQGCYREGLGPNSVEIVCEAIENLDLLPSISQVMLAWVAVGRVTLRVRLHDASLADFCFDRYRSLCNEITGGKSFDVFGVLPKADTHSSVVADVQAASDPAA